MAKDTETGRAVMKQADAIRRFNDQFRQTFVGGTVLTTVGVRELKGADQVAIIRAVQRFDDFHPENDPFEEHDFGAFDHDGTRYFWKIDYYDLDLHHRSKDPADPAFTMRVLTIMRADEY
ncbi:DUF3768 domain-containing protein [Notoacmeibacter ruber]|nr:DUF3768 domain-containing protein [Notoacmeibacter ruber]